MLKCVIAIAALAACTPVLAEQVRHDVVVDGVRIAYWTSRDIKPGETPIVFLHGGPGYNSYSFRHTMGVSLESIAPMVYMDERGSGASERPLSKNYTLQSMAKDIEGLRKALGVEKIIPLGHSFGGAVAATYASSFPSHVDRLILASAATDMPATMGVWADALKATQPAAFAREQATAAGKALAAVDPKDTCALSKARFAFVKDAVEKLPDPLVFYTMQQFRNPAAKVEQKRMDAEGGYQNTGEVAGAIFGPKSDFLCYRVDPSKLSMPVLVIVGKYDLAVGAAPQAALARQMPHGKYVELQNSAHFGYEEEPKAFKDAVEAFLH